MLANALRNGWAYAVIYYGQLTERTATSREDRAGWYARQVMGRSNFETGWLGRVLSGHLGFQIEHHLFPNIPAWRYPAMAPRVHAICEHHGLPYTTGSLASQFASAMRRLVRFAVPGRGAPTAPAPRRSRGASRSGHVARAAPTRVTAPRGRPATVAVARGP